MLKFIIFLFVYLNALSLGSGCRCGIIGEKAKFCTNDYAIIAKVTKERRVGNELEYQLAHIKCLKSHVEVPNKVYTSTDQAMCGVILEKGSTYLLSGTYFIDKDGIKQRHIGLCKIVRKLTKAEVKEYKAPTC